MALRWIIRRIPMTCKMNDSVLGQFWKCLGPCELLNDRRIDRLFEEEVSSGDGIMISGCVNWENVQQTASRPPHPGPSTTDMEGIWRLYVTRFFVAIIEQHPNDYRHALLNWLWDVAVSPILDELICLCQRTHGERIEYHLLWSETHQIECRSYWIKRLDHFPLMNARRKFQNPFKDRMDGIKLYDLTWET